MKRYLKKLGCLVCCLCLAASFWGCKVETVEQHQQAASSQASQAQNSSSKTGAGKEEKDSSKPSGSSQQEGQGNKAGESAGENAEKASVPPASNTPEAPAVSQPGSLPSSGAQPQSGGASSAPAEPAPPAPEPEPETITVTVSVLCTLAVGNPNLNPGVTVPSDGVMVSGLSLELTPGQTAFDALSQTGLALDYSGSPSRKDVYLRGIGGLYQKDCGPSSGWVFSVNGAYPNTSCSKVALSDGDVVSFQFTDGTKLN